MSISFPLIILIAAVGGVISLILLGLGIFVGCRRRNAQHIQNTKDPQLSHLSEAIIELRSIENGNVTQEDIKNNRQELYAADSKETTLKSMKCGENDMVDVQDNYLTRTRKSSTCDRFRASHETEADSLQGNYEDINLDEHLLDEKEVCTSPRTPADRTSFTRSSSKRSDLSWKRLPRKGYHLPGNPRGWRYLARPDRPDSSRWFSEPSTKNLTRASNKRNSQQKVTRRGSILRSGSLNLEPSKRKSSVNLERNDTDLGRTMTMRAIISPEEGSAIIDSYFLPGAKPHRRASRKFPTSESHFEGGWYQQSLSDSRDCNTFLNRPFDQVLGKLSEPMDHQLGTGTDGGSGRPLQLHNSQPSLDTNAINTSKYNHASLHGTSYSEQEQYYHDESWGQSLLADAGVRDCEGLTAQESFLELAKGSDKQRDSIEPTLPAIVFDSQDRKIFQQINGCKLNSIFPDRPKTNFPELEASQVQQPKNLGDVSSLGTKHLSILPNPEAPTIDIFPSLATRTMTADLDADPIFQSLMDTLPREQSNSSLIFNLYADSDVSLPYNLENCLETSSIGTEDETDHLQMLPRRTSSAGSLKVTIRDDNLNDMNSWITSQRSSSESYNIVNIPPLKPSSRTIQAYSTKIPSAAAFPTITTPPRSPSRENSMQFSSKAVHRPQASIGSLISRYNPRHNSIENDDSHTAKLGSSTLRPIVANKSVTKPPTYPLPPGPPPFAKCNQPYARMASMMMSLRRQNSESSRCDSTYFFLPQAEKLGRSNTTSIATRHIAEQSLGQNQSNSGFDEDTRLLKDASREESRVHNEKKAPMISMKAITIGNVNESSLLVRRAALRGSQKDLFMVQNKSAADNFKNPFQVLPSLKDNSSIVQTDWLSYGDSKYPFQTGAKESPSNDRRHEPKMYGKDGYNTERSNQHLVGHTSETSSKSRRPSTQFKSNPEARNRRSTAHPNEGNSNSKNPSALNARSGSKMEFRFPIDNLEDDLSPVAKKIMDETRKEHHQRQVVGNIESTAYDSAYPNVTNSRPSASAKSPNHNRVQSASYRSVHSRHRRMKSSLSSIGEPISPSRIIYHNQADHINNKAIRGHQTSTGNFSSMKNTPAVYDHKAKVPHAAGAGNRIAPKLARESKSSIAGIEDGIVSRRESKGNRVSELRDRVAGMENVRGRLVNAAQ